MNATSGRSPLLVILGPTAAGKSALGVALAERLGGEVVVCDSTQVYRHFDIGTAKVTASERRGVPHHLVDLVEPDEVFTAGDFQRAAVPVLQEIGARKRLPVMTAGTGLYLRALIDGLSEAPTRSEELREKLRERAARRGPEYLHRVLARVDRTAAARIAPRDTQKIIRAIEMRMVSGKPVSEIHNAGRNALQGFEVKKIGLAPAREALYTRIDARVHAMVRAGWIEEVRGLVARGVPPEAKPFQFIGYTQLREHIAGRMGLDEATASIQQATRRFAKRQMTWFRREKDVHWLEGCGDDPEIITAATQWAAAEFPELASSTPS